MLIASILMATMAPAPAGNVDTTRAAFTKCLRAHLKKQLEAKVSEAEFALSVKSACETEQSSFAAAVTAANRAGGDSAADAAENAEMQVDDYHANFTDKFKDYSSTNTMPGE
ncbi:hypothetical protein [Sphingopyxis sp. RIFCSPHIGHO2_12_FULL_65_19]|uniref:hypothetical protein n=1 Tax=Sphingopyxis sp. RIFCSPHIGHO2_12_FULL_65_19 TaxID=1802172 RepID=UPI0008B6AB39|nr:hypothetical protein [Sphingopyxis sp. RIFCSPHIGHO2_12_FULL_65_19]OHD05236.1 MAG: hypothetical protein A3E77_01675 [Sphingopyxis sp. RIFCSPHIGHO2_12_FULL_65_19]